MPTPVICLVTGRHRLRREDGWPADAGEAVLAQLAAAVEAGVDLVQIRERDLGAAALHALTRAAVGLAAGSSTRILVNDRLDVALAAGAAGVHLREDSVPTPRARELAPPPWLVSRAVHDAAAAAAQGTAPDFLVFGTVYPSASKPGTAAGGPAVLRAVVDAARVPVLAIGGASVERAPEIASAGAAGLAAIGLFTGAEAAAKGGMAAIVARVRGAWRAL